MQVKELIEALQKMPPDARVFFHMEDPDAPLYRDINGAEDKGAMRWTNGPEQPEPTVFLK